MSHHRLFEQLSEDHLDGSCQTGLEVTEIIKNDSWQSAALSCLLQIIINVQNQVFVHFYFVSEALSCSSQAARDATVAHSSL